jgi:flagellar motor switch protein FliM
MSSSGSPAEMQDLIVERLTGATGDPARVVDAARALAERCLASVVPAFAEAFPSAVTFECTDVRLARFAEGRPPEKSPWAMTIASADVSPDALLMTIEPDALSLALSAVFGGDETMPLVPIERDLSPIEVDLAAQIFDIFATSFNGSGERALAVRFPLPRPITGPDIAKQVIRDGPAVSITFEARLGPNAGRIHITMPQRVLAQHRGEATAGSKNGSAAWRERFNEEVMRSAVTLEATMPLATLTLGQLAALEPGQLIEMPASAPTHTKLHAKDKTLFVCEFGKLGQNYTVRITQPFDAQQEFVDGLVGAEAGGNRRH